MNRLPTEILSLVFFIILDMNLRAWIDSGSGHGRFETNVTPLVLGTVCLRWRRIIHGNERYWNNILITFGYPVHGSLATKMSGLTEFYLRKSGTKPLSISVLSESCLPASRRWETNRVDEHIPALISLFKHHLRWESVHFHLPINSIPYIPPTLPMLRRCHLSFNPALITLKPWPLHGRFPVVWSQLTDLRLTNVGTLLMEQISDFGSLTRLTIDLGLNASCTAPSISTILRMLQRCSRTLVYLRLQTQFIGSEQVNSHTVITMDGLEEAELDVHYIDLLQYLKLPRLVTFTSNFAFEPSPLATLSSFIHDSNPPIRCLVLLEADMDLEDLITVLNNLPTLTTLGLLNSGPQSNPFDGSLLHRLSLSHCRSCEDILLPNLTDVELGFDYDLVDPEDEDFLIDGLALVEMLSSRFYLDRNPETHPPCSSRCSSTDYRCRAKPLKRLSLNGLDHGQHLDEEVHDVLGRMKHDGLDLLTSWTDGDLLVSESALLTLRQIVVDMVDRNV
ncbi:hypothetical protein AAF712_004820 [Marasmius tenuissimus]|uniref:F-box domain-containing protein n=1 Tax=Marasmius tenuissimus TaxID=585030 RepID=A0ABR3A2G2_9AGAR